MSKCKKVKNPCKICLETVTQKTGLQCQGACQSWVHYSCLNYTPGKIRDIKTGVIKVTCPCPDCKTTTLKEYRTDEPFSCSNAQCPAHRPPKCNNMECPINTDPQAKIANQTAPEIAPIMKCGVACKQYSAPNSQQVSTQSSYNGMSPEGSPCHSLSEVGDMPRGGHKPRGVAATGAGFPSMQDVEHMCNAVGQLTTQINDLMCRMKQSVKDQGGSGGGCCPKNKKNCSQKGPKSQCPAPCYCPGNPARRK